jgi:hypothetical protein
MKFQVWVLLNFDRWIATFDTRKEAIQRGEELLGASWKVCRKHLQVKRATLTVDVQR